MRQRRQHVCYLSVLAVFAMNTGAGAADGVRRTVEPVAAAGMSAKAKAFMAVRKKGDNAYARHEYAKALEYFRQARMIDNNLDLKTAMVHALYVNKLYAEAEKECLEYLNEERHLSPAGRATQVAARPEVLSVLGRTVQHTRGAGAAVQLLSREGAAPRAMAQVLLLEGKKVEALALMQAAIDKRRDIGTSTHDELLQAGALSFEVGSLAVAKRYALAALKKKKDHDTVGLWVQCCKKANDLEEYEKALRVWTQVPNVSNKERAAIVLELAALLHKHKRYQEALPYFLQSNDLDSSFAALWSIAQTYEVLGNNRLASSFAEKAYRANPKNQIAYLMWAQNLAKTGQSQAAIQMFSRLQKDPQLAETALFHSCALRMSLGEKAAAEAEFLSLRRRFPKTRHTLEEARKHALRYTQGFDGFYTLFVSTPRQDDAQKLAQLKEMMACQKAHQQDAEFFVKKANLEIQLERLQEALLDSEKALALDRQSLAAHEARAIALRFLGRVDEARAERQIAVALFAKEKERTKRVEQKP